MTKREIEERIAQGEDSRTQFKRGPVGVAKLAAEFAAFSNAGGGVILFTFATKEIPYRGLGSGVKRILEIVQDIEFKSDDELNLFTVIVKRNKENVTVNEVVKDVDEAVNGSDEVVNGVDEVVIEVVKQNPGIRKPRLVPLVGKSRATVERMIAHLIKVGKIEFRGAPKNGGYYLKEQK